LPYMPRYHFDVIGRNTIADRTGLLLPDDIHASDAADRLARELYEIRPELRVRECAVLVTDDDGEEVHRAPIVKVH
jgi:F420-0:gamma-glutamyl ligase